MEMQTPAYALAEKVKEELDKLSLRYTEGESGYYKKIDTDVVVRGSMRARMSFLCGYSGTLRIKVDPVVKDIPLESLMQAYIACNMLNASLEKVKFIVVRDTDIIMRYDTTVDADSDTAGNIISGIFFDIRMLLDLNVRRLMRVLYSYQEADHTSIFDSLGKVRLVRNIMSEEASADDYSDECADHVNLFEDLDDTDDLLTFDDLSDSDDTDIDEDELDKFLFGGDDTKEATMPVRNIVLPRFPHLNRLGDMFEGGLSSAVEEDERYRSEMKSFLARKKEEETSERKEGEDA